MPPRRRKSKTATASIVEIHSDEAEMEIPEEEQVRLVKASGILDATFEKDDEGEQGAKFMEEILDCLILLVPFSSLYLLMDILVRQQYAQELSFGEEFSNMLTAVPILAVLIFYTNRYKSHWLVHLAMSLASIGSGYRMIYAINRLSWSVVIRQCPPLGVIWVYTIVQLPLSYACLALVVVAAIVRYTSLRIIF